MTELLGGAAAQDTDKTGANDLEEMKAFFEKDYFAFRQAGIEIVEAQRGDETHPPRAKCIMPVTENHLNASGFVMGGAIFTLADLTASVASNAGQPNTVTEGGQIRYLRGADCKMLTADAVAVFSGKKTNYCEVTVTDENGTLIAKASFSGFRILPDREKK